MTEYQTHAALVAQLDRTASELQDTCHKQAQRIAVLEQAARQALEVLSELAEWESEGDPRHPATTAITALREALEAAPPPTAVVQEPVLVVEREPSYTNRGHFYRGDKPHIDPTKVWKLPIGTELYTAPQPARQPLTDEQIDNMVATATLAERDMFRRFARAIERAHGIGGEA